MSKEVFMVEQEEVQSSSSDVQGHLKLEDVMPKLDKPWFRYRQLLILNMYCAGAVLCMVTAGFDGTMMNNLQTLPSFKKHFHNPKGAALGTLNVGTTAGGLIWAPFALLLADWLGRKKLIIIGNCFIILGAILQGCSTSIGMFIGARFLLGFGGISVAGAGPLLAELAFPSQRPEVTSFLAASFPLGSFAAALVTWGPYHSSMKYNDWSWRLPSLLQMALPLLSTALILFSPDSPRWLISKNREEEATKILVKYHGFGDPESPLVHFEISEIKAALAMEKGRAGKWWREWVRTSANRKRLAITVSLPMMMQFCGNALISYYLTLILDNIGITKTTDQLKINLGLTTFGLIWAWIVSSVCGRFKRKTLFFSSYGSMSFFFLIWIVLSAINQERDFKDKKMGIAIVAMIYMFQAGYHLATPIAVTYCTEILPFSLRGTGITIYQFFGGCAGMFNNYVNPIAMNAIEWKYYIVWCVWLLVQIAIIYFFFPETYGHSLEEIAVVFGDNIADIKRAGDKAILGTEIDKPVTSHEEDIECKDSQV